MDNLHDRGPCPISHWGFVGPASKFYFSLWSVSTYFPFSSQALILKYPELWAPSQNLPPENSVFDTIIGDDYRRMFWFSSIIDYYLYSCLENPMDGGAWWAAVHGVTKSRIWLSVFTFTFHFHALEKEMATHSSVIAWRIPGTGEPGGLPSMGSHRVGHHWSNLAAAAAAGIF